MIGRKYNGQIIQDAVRNLTAGSNISYFGQGSIAKNIIDVVAREIEAAYDSIDINMSQSRLITASGAFLDLIAQQYGISRLPGSVGSVEAEDRAVRFYVTSGRLIDRLGQTGGAGSINSGTKVYNRDRSLSYTVTSTTSFPASATSVFVPVAPTDSTLGTGNNVSSGTLVAHDLGTGIFVENTTGIVGGTNVETDEELRLRISRYIGASVPGSKISVTQAAFSNAGVSDLKVFNHKHGAGSFEVLVVPIGNTVAGSVLDAVRNSIARTVPFGIRFTVRGPTVMGFGTTVQIDMRPGSLGGAKEAARLSARAAIKAYIASIPMGGQFVVNRMLADIIGSNPSIQDVRILSISINCRPRTISNYQLQFDEVIDLDRKLAEPIMII
jgi:uncharacterized phage protein gp47/JayE